MLCLDTCSPINSTVSLFANNEVTFIEQLGYSYELPAIGMILSLGLFAIYYLKIMYEEMKSR